MKKKRMIMIVAMVLVLVWREDVFAVESGTTQVSLQADWLQEGDYQYSVEEDETVTLPKLYRDGKRDCHTERSRWERSDENRRFLLFEKNGSSGSADIRRHC